MLLLLQRRRSKIAGDAVLKQSQHQISYASSAASIQNLTGNIQKQLAAAVAAAEITTAVTTVVSTSAVATVVTQAPTKALKQISSASSSRSASPQVTVSYQQQQQQQQYIIQHQPQQALYTMGLSQLGAIIPGLMPQADPSKTSSQSSTPIATATTSSSEQAKTDLKSPSVSIQPVSKDEESTKKCTPSSVTAHSVIQATPTPLVEKSRHSSVTSIASASTSVSSVSTTVSSAAGGGGGVIINPYQYYAITAGSVAVTSSVTSSSTPSSTKEKTSVSASTASSKPLAVAASVSTTAQSSVATPTVMPTQQMQYAVVNAGGQQQLYAMPSGAQIQTGYLFFQQPNGMMVAIPAQTVVQPGGSTQVAIAPQQLAALSGGTVALQQQQKATTTSSPENNEEKTKESGTPSSTSTTQKQQQQLYVPMPVVQQYELSKPPTERGSKGKRSSSSSVSEEFQKGSSKDQHHHIKHHSTTPTSASGFKYSPLYIPRGAHAYRVAAAQASAAAAMSTQQSPSVTTTTSATATTVSSSTTLEKTKEADEASAGSLVPIQLVQQPQYSKEQHGVIQQHKQATTTSATTVSTIASNTTITSQSKMTVPAMYGGLAVAGRTGMLLNAAGGTTVSGTPHMQQMMLRAVAQGPSGVYEVKASSLADIDPSSVKNLTEKYEHKIVKMDLQTALVTRTENENSSVSAESDGKPEKTLTSASHKGLADQLPPTGDEAATTMQQTVEHKDETTKPATKKRSRAKKPVQVEGTEPSVDKTVTPANDTSTKPSTTATRKRKGAKEGEEEGEQEVTQAAKRKRGPNKRKSAGADESLGTEEESKPTRTPATQRGKKGKASNETAKGTLKSAVVSISLEALAGMPSPLELDEVSTCRIVCACMCVCVCVQGSACKFLLN